MDQGDVIIRPRSKGEDHLTVSWKVSASGSWEVCTPNCIRRFESRRTQCTYEAKISLMNLNIYFAIYLGVWEHLPAHRCEGAGQGQLLLPGPVPLDRGRGVRRSGRNYRQVNTSRVEVMDVQSALDYFPDPDLTFLSTQVAFYEQRKGRKRLTTFCTATKDIP